MRRKCGGPARRQMRFIASALAGKSYSPVCRVPEKVAARAWLLQNGRVATDHFAIVNQLPDRVPAFPAFFAQGCACFPIEAFHGDTNPMPLGFRSKSDASSARVKGESERELTDRTNARALAARCSACMSLPTEAFSQIAIGMRCPAAQALRRWREGLLGIHVASNGSDMNGAVKKTRTSTGCPTSTSS